jgi:cytoskeletal protein CcmA (bactofilin family)
MAIWKETSKEGAVTPFEAARENPLASETASASTPAPARHTGEPKASVIGTGLVIEGKIEGDGDVHIAGSFKGDVRVNGDVTVEPGARISAEISAGTVTVGGQVEGNINASTQVKLLQSGQLIGDLKAKSLTVAAGSRMRGRVEFGWDDHESKKIELNVVKKTDGRTATI